MRWTTGPDGVVDWFSPKYLTHFGVTLDNSINAQFYRKSPGLAHPDDIGEAAAAWLRSVATGDPYEGPIVRMLVNGDYHRCRAQAVPVFDAGGKVIQWRGVTVDLDEPEAELLRGGVQVFTTAELAERWKCSDGQVRRLIDKGKVRSFRLGKLVRVGLDAVQEYEGWRNIELCRVEESSPSNGMTQTAPGGEGPSEHLIVVRLSPKLGAL